jgi:hypothetical protein
LLWYNSRHYDPELGRFIQPDSIVPLASQGVQAYDRYGYVNNNPVRYTDPSGHCIVVCTAIIGGAVGAIAGGFTYAFTTWGSGREWNNDEYLASVGVGLVGGALIGTGVGYSAGIAAFSTIGAGTGVVGGEIGYSIASGKEYDSGEMAIAASVGGASGAITGGISGSSLTGTTTGIIINAGTQGTAGSMQYALTEKYNGRNPQLSTVMHTGLVTAGNSLIWDSPSIVYGTSQSRASFWIGAANNPNTRDAFKNTFMQIARGHLRSDTVKEVFRSSLSYLTEEWWK